MMHRLVGFAIAFLAMVLIAVAVASPWMSIPNRIVERSSGEVICEAIQPKSALAFQIACVGFAVAMGTKWAQRRRTSEGKAIIAAGFLATLLFFPFSVMALEPRFSSAATWLQVEHENLVWLGGDLYTNLEFSSKSWKEQVYVVDVPRQINVIRMPSSRLGAFQFGLLMNWFETFGYSNRFCQFVGIGWIAAVLGTAMLLLVQCLPDGRLCRDRMIKAVAGFSVVLALGLIVAGTPVLLSASRLDGCHDSVARGDFERAERQLEAAAWYLPALREDTYYVAQRGVLDWRQGRRSTAEGKLFHANLLERQGRFAQALEFWNELLVEVPRGTAVHREAVRALMRDGIHAFNGQRNDHAIGQLERVLEEHPCDLKANYTLQLAYLRAQRRADVERLTARLVAVYGHFQMPTKGIVLASSYENCMLAAYREHDLKATTHFAAKAKQP